MFFLLTYALLNKYYSSFLIYFFIGITAYLIFFLLSKDFLGYKTIDDNQLFIFIFVQFDILGLILLAKYNSSQNEVDDKKLTTDNIFDISLVKTEEKNEK